MEYIVAKDIGAHDRKIKEAIDAKKQAKRNRRASAPDTNTDEVNFSIEYIIDSTEWDDSFDYGSSSSPKPIRAAVEIQYRDASGSETRREVDVSECDTESSNGYLIGVCRKRGAYRTFRMDRVRSAIDLETGEVIDDLPTWARRKYEESPAFAIEALIKESSDVLRAMFYIGKADGRFTRKEKQIFLDYCTNNLTDSNLDIDDIDRICNQIEIPSKQAFKLICGRLAQLDQEQRAAIISISKVETTGFSRSALAPLSLAAVDAPLTVDGAGFSAGSEAGGLQSPTTRANPPTSVGGRSVLPLMAWSPQRKQLGQKKRMPLPT